MFKSMVAYLISHAYVESGLKFSEYGMSAKFCKYTEDCPKGYTMITIFIEDCRETS